MPIFIKSNAKIKLKPSNTTKSISSLSELRTLVHRQESYLRFLGYPITPMFIDAIDNRSQAVLLSLANSYSDAIKVANIKLVLK